ncbi:NAD(P)/FAD-dependent oxidoreductase [Oharaeibacter diazotrophicus]|uniref:Sarcosine oxidase subunit beta n=1 Tax=Oharaeibacter diazotrophicus TaxID=1920512 RepID=A0A4R6RKE8_9HYPH|nr:FAD-binding oxidoreductase [Oharaeibacter diazotrophicus]TDP87079.1 sarcosine oxidase subunit beta [Oharaeibacter diazotrophicus]BBE70978.1 glycine oxidase [Pleomorphomonas sp. SM30]GLS77728.1 FAD-binding oxidoreductase [Oharaeibacter diazotrophicus]
MTGEAIRGAAVVVVGAGASGLSAAWWLARSGVDVLVLDKGIVGWEASGRNGGGCTHYQSPLFHEEQRLWPTMDDLLGYPTEYRRERIIIATTEEHLALYRSMGERLGALGYPWEPIDARQARERVPLAGDTVLGGVHFKVGGHANPQRTVQAYAWATRDLGGRVVQHAPVTAIRRGAGGRVVGVETPRGLVGCDHLVIAAGPQTGRLAAMVGADLPLAMARAEMVVTEPLPLMPIGGVDGNGLYGRQTLRGNLAYGGGPHEWLDLPAAGAPLARPTTPLTRNLARRIAELLPKAAHARVIRSWAGLIENTPDGRPVIERLAEPDNVTLCTMSAVGFGLSPATGRAIRDLVVDGTCSFADISKFRLARFAGLDPDWRRANGWVEARAA